MFYCRSSFSGELINIDENPKTFVDVVVGYGRMTLSELGFDTTLTFDGFQMIEWSNTFNMVKVVFWRKSLASRGTTCFDLTKTCEH